MVALPIRFINQLDGSRNQNNNCVPASLASGAAAFGVNVSAVQLLDAEYGASYTGPTAPWRYADDASDTLRALGLTLDAVSGMDEAALVAQVHAEIAAGNPCMLAIPSQWGNFSIPVSVRRAQRWPDGSWLSTHFVCAYDSYAGGVGCENSWGAFRHVNTDGDWASLLVLGTIWVLRKVGSGMSGIPAGWHDDGTTLTAPNAHRVVHGFRAYILANAWDAAQQPTSEEYGVAAGAVQQDFQATTRLHWDAATNVTPHPGPDYAAEAGAAQAQVASLTQQLAAATAQIATLTAQIATLTAQLADCQAHNSGGDPLAQQALATLKALKALWAQVPAQ